MAPVNRQPELSELRIVGSDAPDPLVHSLQDREGSPIRVLAERQHELDLDRDIQVRPLEHLNEEGTQAPLSARGSHVSKAPRRGGLDVGAA